MKYIILQVIHTLRSNGRAWVISLLCFGRLLILTRYDVIVFSLTHTCNCCFPSSLLYQFHPVYDFPLLCFSLMTLPTFAPAVHSFDLFLPFHHPPSLCLSFKPETPSIRNQTHPSMLLLPCSSTALRIPLWLSSWWKLAHTPVVIPSLQRTLTCIHFMDTAFITLQTA